MLQDLVDKGVLRAMTLHPEPPLALLAELTHRCPLHCPYCSNPVELERPASELDTATWRGCSSEAAALGVLQVHFSGGEPLVRRDLVELVAHAAAAGLYTNLITSGVGLDRARMAALGRGRARTRAAQLPGRDAGDADRVGGFAGAHAKKRRAAAPCATPACR